MILDGRFLRSVYSAELDGAAVVGMGIEGYDNYLQQHKAVWMDTLGTSVHAYAGTCNEDGSVITMESQHADPVTGKIKTATGVTTIHGRDRFTYEQWDEQDGGEPFRSMLINYRRKQEG